MRVSLSPETVMGSAMDALLLRSLQSYVLDTFGIPSWQEICRLADSPVETFEPMLHYDSGMADRIAQVAAERLGRPVDAIWEDVGTHLVTNPDQEGVRRLLRFGGISFVDFLHSLEELPGRARLAMPGLDLPEFSLTVTGPDQFELRIQSHLRGTQRVLSGILTAMADDYGALCVIEPATEDCTTISVLDRTHATARHFDLAMPER
jgi:Haem-NO-binding